MADLDGLKKVLRSLVVSSAATMDAASLLRDYRRMLGEPLPAARYGFRDPVQFLRERCGDCFLFHGPYANPILTLIVPDSIKHIDQYVQSQKSSKLIKGKRRSVPESIIRNPPPNLIANTFKRVPPNVEESKRYTNNTPTHTQKPQPEAPRVQQTYTDPTKSESPPLVAKPVAVTAPVIKRQPDSHAQANPEAEAPVGERPSHGHEDGPCSRQMMERFFEKRMPVYQSQRMGDSKESHKDDDLERQTSSSLSSRSAAALTALQSQLVRLVARRPQGVWCSELLRLYEEEYGCELDFGRFRYPSVSACACAVAELAAMRGPSGDWLVTVKGEKDADVFPADCLSFLESIPGGEVAGVQPGDMLGVIVGEVYSPSHLWLLRLGPDFDLMEQYMDEMTEYYSKGEGANRVLAAGARRVGQYCSTVFEGDWHRSLIVQLVDSDTVKVRHVDYGTVDTVSVWALRPLRRAWAALPAQAVRARLAGLRPAAACRRWPRPAAAYCLQLVRERRLVGNVVAVDHKENILELFLIDTSTADDVNLTDQMIRAGHADPRPLPALGTQEAYLLPAFWPLETGETPNYAEIHALLRDGIALDYVDSYRQHVAPLVPSSSDDSDSDDPERQETVEPPPPPPPAPAPALLANRVPMLSVLRLASSPERAAAASPSSSHSPASTVASLSPPPASPSPSPPPASPAASLSPSPPPASPAAARTPFTPAASYHPSASPMTSLPAPAAPAPARCPPHPASFYALPFYPARSAPAPAPLPAEYAAGYYRPHAPPQPAPPHFYAQYHPPQPAVGYYPNHLHGQPVFKFKGAGATVQNFAPAHPVNFVPNSMRNTQMFVPNAAIPRHFVPFPAQNPQYVASNSVQNSRNFVPSPAPKPQNGPFSVPSGQCHSPSLAPSSRDVGSSSSLSVSGASPAGAEVRLSGDDCEFFELLSGVDPGAAHRYMVKALREARAAAGQPPPPPSPPALNPNAAEFRCPTQPGFRPPPGFEHFIK